MIAKVKSYMQSLRLMAMCWVGARKTKVYVNLVQDQTVKIADAFLVLILVIKDEADRVPYLLDYYRKLGVEHFIVLDNMSTDDLHDVLLGQDDVTLAAISQNYNESRYGVHWINYMARRYCRGKWVLSIDADEFFVYPNIDRRSIRDLCRHLDDNGVDRFFTPMIDMYGANSVIDSKYNRFDNPLTVCHFFDGEGYFTVKGGLGDPWMRGGVRMRVFNANTPLQSPALNKFALLKWSGFMFYFKGAHVLIPKRKNKILDVNGPTGALLHFKFFSDLYDKAVYAVEHGNHYNDSEEYRRYIDEMTILENPLVYSGSKRYTGVDSLIESGLVRPGDWY